MALAFWYGILVVSALAFAVVRLSIRHLVRTHGTLPSLFLFEIIGSVVLLPFAFMYGSLPVTSSGWLALFVLLVALIVGEYLGVKSYEAVSVSEREPILALTIFFTMVLGAVYFHENVTLYDVAGAVLIFMGVLTLSWQRGFSALKTRGHLMLLIVAFGLTFIMLLNAYVLKETAVVTLAALSYTVCAITYGILIRNRVKEVRVVISKSIGIVLLAIGSSILAYTFSLWAIANVGAVVPTLFARLTPVFVAIGAFLFYKDERVNMVRTGVAILFTVVGCVLVIM